MQKSFASWVAFPNVFYLAVGLALILLLPSLSVGFFADDYLFISMIEKRTPVEYSIFDMYRFTSIHREFRDIAVANGIYPWWVYSELHVNFFRPISSILFWLDYQFFGRHPLGYHLHCLLWLCLFLLALKWIYQRTLPAHIGSLALLIYAINPAHGLASAWPSNRHALISVTFVLFGFCAHIRFREDHWKIGLPLSLVGYTLGLMSGETAISALIYVGFYELLLGPGNFRKRILALVPVLSLGVLYTVFYKKSGYGSFGSGFYNDPVTEPLGYLKEALFRIPTLLADQYLRAPSDFWMLSPKTHPILAGIGVVAILLMGFLLKNGLSRLEPKNRKVFYGFLLSSLVSLLPVIATIPMTRLLLCPFIGGAVLIAFVLHSLKETLVDLEIGFLWKRRFFKGIYRFLWILTFIIAPLQLLGTSLLLIFHEVNWKQSPETFDQIPQENPPHLILTVAPDHTFLMYFMPIRAYFEKPLPKTFHVLSAAIYDHLLTRIDERTLELTIKPPGRMLDSEFEKLYRSSHFPIQAGYTKKIGEVYEVEVIEADSYAPVKVRYHFQKPLEDPSLLFVYWKAGKLQRLPALKFGQELEIPKTMGPSGL